MFQKVDEIISKYHLGWAKDSASGTGADIRPFQEIREPEEFKRDIGWHYNLRK